MENDEELYDIVRFHFNGENEVIAEGVTLEEAQEHCSSDDRDEWGSQIVDMLHQSRFVKQVMRAGGSVVIDTVDGKQYKITVEEM